MLDADHERTKETGPGHSVAWLTSSLKPASCERVRTFHPIGIETIPFLTGMIHKTCLQNSPVCAESVCRTFALSR